MSRTSPGRLAALADEGARRAIREDLGTTILVEAAAGTGKTQSLVDRMVTLVATGKATMDHLSAVTFTVRAAAQLRQRFQNALEASLRQAEGEIERSRLSEALTHLDSCFLGTIHAFSERLLRERPVEAGLPPGFSTMDEPEDGTARLEAWNRFTEALYLEDDPRLARMIELGIPLEDLRETFETICENSDVEAAVGPQPAEPDFTAALNAVAAFLDRAAASLPEEVPTGGWKGFPEAVRRARRLSDLLETEHGADFARILRVLRPSSAMEGAGALKKPFERLREDVVKPALSLWTEYAHAPVMEVLIEARERYAAWRRREGRLNFQDLLLYARNLLRDHPEVREALRKRFAPILVDEFQDTDPIQAEILFYLTGEQTSEKDWMKLVPLPGSLFLVGDPKQSIYRFRRADIVTYELVRGRIEACGRILRLSTSFRSTGALCDWVNRVFARPQFFPAAPSTEQAGYVALAPAAPDAAHGPVAFRLETAAVGNAGQPVAEQDARSIADFIAGAVAQGGRRPGDFLLLFRRRKFMPAYARALEERRVPYDLGGGDAFQASEELEALMPPLRTIADPDDAVSFLATLRGPLFGVDDEALYRFAQAGGRFTLLAEPPKGADPRIGQAVELLREAAERVESLPPAAAISSLADRLGWAALAAAQELGDSRAGSLCKALSAARRFSGEGMDFPAVVRELDNLRQQPLIEEMGLDPGRPNVVRLMTLHGAKGLEAPVVFLAEPTRDPGGRRQYWIRRESKTPEGYFRVSKRVGKHGDEEIARPAGWEAIEEAEERFERAERVRLLYVGATRAKEMLVVSIKRAASGSPQGPWAALDRYLEAPLSAPAAAGAQVPAPSERLAEEFLDSRKRREEARKRSARPGYAVAPVTGLAHAEGAKPAWERTGRGMSWGRVIHQLLEALMRDPKLPLREYAQNLLAEEERPPEDLEEAIRLVERVRGSNLWQRALRARRCLVEVPFALKVASAQLGLATVPSETLLQGAIDLAFEEDSGWILIDYKSDTVSNNFQELVNFYASQVAHYQRYWQQLTSRPTKAGLFFVETGQEAWLEEK